MKNYSFWLINLIWLAFIPDVNAGCIYEDFLRGENLQIGNMLTWSTSSEMHNVLFFVERSKDGVEFTEIGSVKGAGNSEEIKDYFFLDPMPGNVKSYYRLKQVDSDGTFSYSEKAIVKPTFKNNFLVADMTSIATKDFFEVTIDAMIDGEMNYKLNSWSGDVVLEDRAIITQGFNELSIDLTDQKEGIYKLSLNMEGEEETLTLKKIMDEIKGKPNVASKNSKPEPGRN